jgi:hypothetical protein
MGKTPSENSSTPTVVQVSPIGLRPPAAAARIGSTAFHVEELMRDGLLPYKIVGGQRVIPVSALDKYFESLPERTGSLPVRGVHLAKAGAA